MTTSQVLPARLPESPALQLAVAGHLARFKGISRTHAESDLRAYLGWCADRGLDPLAASRPHVELYVRWMQEIRRLRPSTVSRRTSIVAGFYRTAVIDGLLEHSPAEHVRRPHVPADSPTLGLTHLQLEALLAAARQSPNRCDFALVCLLGLLGLRIFEATGLNIGDLGEEHGHHVLRVAGKGGKTVLIPLPPAVGRALDRAIGDRITGPILLNRRGARMDRHAATRRLRALAQSTGMRMPPLHPHTYVTTMLDAGVDLRDVQIAARHADPRTTMRYDRARNQLDRHPNYILAAYVASGTWPADPNAREHPLIDRPCRDECVLVDLTHVPKVGRSRGLPRTLLPMSSVFALPSWATVAAVGERSPRPHSGEEHEWSAREDQTPRRS